MKMSRMLTAKLITVSSIPERTMISSRLPRFWAMVNTASHSSTENSLDIT